MAGPQPIVTETELMEAMAREMPPDVRMAVRMPGEHFKSFHRTELMWTMALEEGKIGEALYNRIMGKGEGGRASFKYNAPAMALPDYVKAIAEAKNATPLLAPVSQAVGAKVVGDKVVPIRREDVPGMDARTVTEIMQESLVRKDISFQSGIEIAEMLAAKKVTEGTIDDEEAKEVIELSRKFGKVLNKLLEGEVIRTPRDIKAKAAPPPELPVPAPVPQLPPPTPVPAVVERPHTRVIPAKATKAPPTGSGWSLGWLTEKKGVRPT